ncbi:DUF3039 domain-containing protein [Microbacterium sp. NPDC078849]|uniref:DUF3039 domain-containing protein n=1 Tax=unclassified Microbacterium TaxID=2609290 RepID=UPI00344C02DA
MSTDTLEKPDTVTTDAGDHDLFSHYARKDDIERSMFEGVEITALCGKKWRPSRDFTKFPVCGTCKTILEGIPE